MTTIEKSKLIDELVCLRKVERDCIESDRKRIESNSKSFDYLLNSFQMANIELCALRVQLSELLKQLTAKDAENACFNEELKLSRKNLYGMKNRRGCSGKKMDAVSREDPNVVFGGTCDSLPSSCEDSSPSGEIDSTCVSTSKEVCLKR